MPVDLPGAHARALANTARIVGGVSRDQLHDPTPDEDWDVEKLLQHIVSGNLWAVELTAGQTIDEVGDRLDGDMLGDDPLGAYDASAQAAAAAFEVAGALDAQCAVSYGPVPGSVYAGHRFIDVLIHGWDLAIATGQDATLDSALVAACLAVVEPQAGLMQASGSYGSHVDAPADADPQTRLLALLGRRPPHE